MRLDKFLSDATELTRSQAKKALNQGLVTVAGEVVKKGNMILEEQEVRLDGELVQLRPPVYVMLHKPEGFVSSNVDELLPSVLQLLPYELQRDVHIAGRLDADTTGLLLITDDGQWSHKITSPKKACGKRYRVELASPVDDSLTERFAEGIMLNGEKKPTLPAVLEVLAPYEVLLTIQEGKYHQVKRMFAASDNRVVTLHRESVGEIELDPDLSPGEWRHLTQQEIESLG